jgi:type IV pilus assembly protein PilC
MSEFFRKWWFIIIPVPIAAVYFFMQAWKRNEKMQMFMDRLLMKVPIFGQLVNKSSVARWTRTLSTMFSAGVPLVESLDSVGGAAGNYVYQQATNKIQQEVSTGTSLTDAMTNANIFPSMVLQLTAIGEESGALDHMLGKAADFYEAEVDEMVAGLSSLMEPLIIVFLGVIIGGIVIAMYLPIFKLGSVV